MKKKFIFIVVVVFCGFGEMIVNNFFVVLNIFIVIFVIFKRWEREVGSIFEVVVNEICNEVFVEEKKRFSRNVFLLIYFNIWYFFSDLIG